MASAPESGDDLFDEFLSRRGHDTESVDWQRDHNKKQCPECGSLHELGAARCSVCGWTPE